MGTHRNNNNNNDDRNHDYKSSNDEYHNYNDNHDNSNDYNNVSDSSTPWQNRKWSHALSPLSTSAIRRLADLVVDETVFKAHLEGILVPRVPGTKGHDRVKAFII